MGKAGHLNTGSTENLTLAEFKWLLSAVAAVASFFQGVGHQRQAEKQYCRYIKLIESVHGADSTEAAHAMFMVGGYYSEQEHHLKSLACFVKAKHLLETNRMAKSRAAADCHFNMGSCFWKLGAPTRAIDHYHQALELRKELVGPVSLPVSDALEQLGKIMTN